MKKTFVLILLFNLSTMILADNEREKKENLLFIAVEDFKPIVGCITNSKSITLKIDKLVSEGTLFTNNHSQQVESWITIEHNDSRIKIEGCNYITEVDNSYHFQRHPDSLLALPIAVSKFDPVRAKTTTGIVLKFKTNSPKVNVYFNHVQGENRGAKFGIYRNGNFLKSISFSRKDTSGFLLDIDNAARNEESIYEVTLPNWSNVSFSKIEIQDGFDLFELKESNNKVYVAYGNSITHGTGQSGTNETYPFLVSRLFNWELYNVAVGGAKTSITIAEMLRDDFIKIDYITILIGYNDYYEGVTTKEYKDQYIKVIRAIREKHTETKIFCISQPYTTQLNSKVSGLPITDYRIAVEEIVQEFKNTDDENIFLINGEKITSGINLKDAVHFSTNGAKLFADSLSNIISSILNLTPTNVKRDEESKTYHREN